MTKLNRKKVLQDLERLSVFDDYDEIISGLDYDGNGYFEAEAAIHIVELQKLAKAYAKYLKQALKELPVE